MNWKVAAWPVFAILFSLISTPPAGAASVKLAWDASADPRVVGYKIHYGTKTGNYTEQVDVQGRLKTRVEITGLEEGKDYYFSITACDADGNESGFGGEVTSASSKPEPRRDKILPKTSPAPPPAPVSAPKDAAGREKIPPSSNTQLEGKKKIPPSRYAPGSSEDSRIPPSRMQ